MRRALVAAALAACAGCIEPSVLDAERREVQVEPAAADWRPARAEDLRGLYEMTSIEGESAAAVWKIYYHFASDGTYTGAALIQGGAHPEFQTLNGAWKLDENGLDLGDGQLARAWAAGDQLKLESEGGAVVLRRVALQ